MKNFILFVTAVATIAFSPTGLAASFNDIEQWQAEKLYHRGDVVRANYDIYISVVPSKGNSPNTENKRWKIIEYNKRQEFTNKKLYPIGSVVTHGGRFYISRGMNVAVESDRLDDSRRWLEFSHPGLIHDLPPDPGDPETEQSLIGVDANHNGIRDDYELAILFSDLPQPVKDAALSAGKAYGELMMTARQDAEINREKALSIMHNLVLAKACRTRLQELYNGAYWEETTYFNTLDRIEAKFKLQWMLQAVIGEEGYNLPRDPAPCVTLSSI